MVDALRVAHRVLKPSGALIDVRPVTAVWAKTVYTYSAQEDVAAADAAVQLAASREWLLFDTSLPFPFEIYCDSAAELRLYAEARKLRGAEIPYEELEDRLRELGAEAPAAACDAAGHGCSAPIARNSSFFLPVGRDLN